MSRPRAFWAFCGLVVFGSSAWAANNPIIYGNCFINNTYQLNSACRDKTAFNGSDDTLVVYGGAGSVSDGFGETLQGACMFNGLAYSGVSANFYEILGGLRFTCEDTSVVNSFTLTNCDASAPNMWDTPGSPLYGYCCPTSAAPCDHGPLVAQAPSTSKTRLAARAQPKSRIAALWNRLVGLFVAPAEASHSNNGTYGGVRYGQDMSGGKGRYDDACGNFDNCIDGGTHTDSGCPSCNVCAPANFIQQPGVCETTTECYTRLVLCYSTMTQSWCEANCP